MGRHSAPDDGPEDAAGPGPQDETPTAVITAPGRHSRPDAGEETAPVDAPLEAGPEFVPGTGIPGLDDAEETADEPPAAPPAPHGSSADLALVRRHVDVRARVAAAVVVPLVLYAVVLLVVGASMRQALLWAFVPLIVAGVLAGYILDVGHKQHAQATPPVEDDH